MNEKNFKGRQEINNRTISNLKHDIDSLRNEYEAYNSDIHNIGLENNELSDVVQSKNSDIERLQNELAEVYEENSIIESEKKELQQFVEIFLYFCL